MYIEHAAKWIGTNEAYIYIIFFHGFLIVLESYFIHLLNDLTNKRERY